MNIKPNNAILVDSTTTIPKVIATLANLDKFLLKSDLANLEPFNHTYLIITRNIYKSIEIGEFNYEEDVQHLILNFICYYFNALENYQNKLFVPKAWEIAFRFCKNKKRNRLLYLAICANAHINNDLAFVLAETMPNKDFSSDYKKIGGVIEMSIKESIFYINKDSLIFSYIDKQLFGLYKVIIRFLLKEWRKAAWNNYLKLINGDKKIEAHIKLTASRKAYEILATSYIIP